MILNAWGRALSAALLDLLAPPRCLACEALAPRLSGYCEACGAPEPLFDIACHIDGVPVFAGVRYAEPVVSALHRFKYGSASELAPALSSPSERGIELLGIEPADVWVPVPLHPLRLAERGYNQSTLIARELSRKVGGRLDPRRLCRLRHTEQQAKRNRTGRGLNVAAAFAVRKPALRPGQRIVLVDDVVTTGATLAACIGALRAAGCPIVGCMAVAYTTRGSTR